MCFSTCVDRMCVLRKTYHAFWVVGHEWSSTPALTRMAEDHSISLPAAPSRFELDLACSHRHVKTYPFHAAPPRPFQGKDQEKRQGSEPGTLFVA
jgi:hypothetical protein